MLTLGQKKCSTSFISPSSVALTRFSFSTTNSQPILFNLLKPNSVNLPTFFFVVVKKCDQVQLIRFLEKNLRLFIYFFLKLFDIQDDWKIENSSVHTKFGNIFMSVECSKILIYMDHSIDKPKITSKKN